jgi:hypothetical protein
MRSTNVGTSSVAPIIGNLPGPDDLLKPEEAAAYLRLSKSTLAKYRHFGGGPVYIKIGRAVRYRRRKLDVWADARSADSTTDADYGLPSRLAGNPGPAH